LNIGQQKRERVAEASNQGSQAFDQSAQPGIATASDYVVI
jgi:hypothetical protein